MPTYDDPDHPYWKQYHPPLPSQFVPPNEQTMPFPDLPDVTVEQIAEIDAEERRRLEQAAMDAHFHKHPHG